MDRLEYVALAKRGIREVLSELHAVAPGELYARLSDRRWETLPRAINPHHVNAALQDLRLAGEVTETEEVTKGNHVVSVAHFADLSGKKAAFRDAARRKRALYARFLGWSQATSRFPRGLLGPGGERVVHRLLIEVAPEVGYRLEKVQEGDVGVFLGEDVPGGPLDNVVHIPVADERGLIARGVVGLVEVKNVRGWIYREDARLYQLLYKAAVLQEKYPDVPFLPVLVCRRVQKKTFEMAKHLGFFVAEAKAQFVQAATEVTPAKLYELQQGLGFSDLVLEHDIPRTRLLRSYFVKPIPRNALRWAQTWATTGFHLRAVYEHLRDPDLPRDERDDYMREIYEVVHPNDPADVDEPDAFEGLY